MSDAGGRNWDRVLFFFFFILAVMHGIQSLSSLTGD